MSQSQVQVSNLPPILIPANLKEPVLAANGNSTISLISSDEDDQIVNCYENGEDGQPTISIINSSDVVIGSVTQFHGPVTIVQHIPAIEDQKQNAGTDEKNKANQNNFETRSETCEPDKPESSPCISWKILIMLGVVVISIVTITLIITLAPLTSPDDGVEYIPDNTNRNISKYAFYPIEKWGGRKPLWVTPIVKPVTWIIVSHTVGPKCQTFASCSRQMRLMQDMHVAEGNPNIGYNFVIGGDAGVYEGRGWIGQNFHLFSKSSLAISFDGNFVHDVLTDEMIESFEELIDVGIKLDIIKPEYRIIAHNQTYATLSPGQNVYSVISQMPNFYQYMRPGMRPD